jgi:hypothetical protein
MKILNDMQFESNSNLIQLNFKFLNSIHFNNWIKIQLNWKETFNVNTWIHHS